MQQKIIILDFGSQTTQLIGRRVRELDTFCEILPYNKFPKDDPSVIGVILSGSPFSVHDPEAFQVDLSQFVGRVPVLGICYGAQFISHANGGRVEKTNTREYGRAHLQYVDTANPLFNGFAQNSQVWMSHGDSITAIPAGYECIASTSDVKYAAYYSAHPSSAGTAPLFAVQFHPEVFHTAQGSLLLKNFVVGICGSRQDWSAASFVDSTVAELKQQLGDDRVILGLSGGVDSSVAAVLLNRAIGKNLTCIFVDHGMLRKNEFRDVMNDYKCLGLNVIGVDASAKFFSDLAGVTDPEKKRKIIGRDFIEVFNAEARKIEGAKWLAQGTIYPDRIESLNITGKVIKSHHNVGGLPEEMHLQLCEPLRWLFKDEVRRVGRQLGMPEHLITRHPFPGPGLAVRILGDITPEKVRILQDADDIYIRGLREYKVKLSGEEARRVLAAGVPASMTDGEIEVSLYDQIWQACTILLSTVRSVGVMGDERTYEHPVALRAVTSTDAMTADWAHLPYDFMARVSNEIINKVRGVNRVCYDISSKPPSTIEWE
ncbi:MAG: glutamine-hydrolyzing GMP synthase [Prevotella sp.]|jgi:GMP synthase (glutamine-hydrolysing)|nr:glutamine-hydrolyzing GMP synthase [Prevotella sp.]MBR3010152.1 glutamine-hydrolyzing GMP synthase [Prevotella sp.]